jgi:hypothetical protein
MKNPHSNLNQKDYTKILEFYKIPIPKSKRLLQQTAENLLSEKLCKCIKKVGNNIKPKNEALAIGICTKTIFNRKGLTRGKFKCKDKNFVSFNKTKKIRNK